MNISSPDKASLDDYYKHIFKLITIRNKHLTWWGAYYSVINMSF